MLAVEGDGEGDEMGDRARRVLVLAGVVLFLLGGATGRPFFVVAALAYRQLNIVENATAYGVLRQGAGIWNANSGRTHST